MQIAFVRGTMIVATIAWALGEALMRRSPASDRLARAFWTLGIALALTHVALAFQLVYAWNHEAAVAATVRQAADRFGRGWQGAIYVNYGFLALWLADVCWWWLAPQSHSARTMRIEMTRFALFTFMFVNGAVVFASGAGRLIGIASVGIAVLAKLKSGRFGLNGRT